MDLFICQQTGKEPQVAVPCREREAEGDTYKKGSSVAGPLCSLCAALSQFLVSRAPSLTGNPFPVPSPYLCFCCAWCSLVLVALAVPAGF